MRQRWRRIPNATGPQPIEATAPESGARWFGLRSETSNDPPVQLIPVRHSSRQEERITATAVLEEATR